MVEQGKGPPNDDLIWLENLLQLPGDGHLTQAQKQQITKIRRHGVLLSNTNLSH